MTINNETLPTVVASTNRFTSSQGYSYDKNGNITSDPVSSGRTFVFNGDNKQVEVKDSSSYTIGRYYYDGNGKRVKKVTDDETTIFVYDGLGKLIAEYSTATPPQDPTINYTATDQLGSPRALLDKFGQVVSRRDFMPFGEELFADGTYRKTSDDYSLTGQDAVRQRFTGYQKDAETSLDFAEARYYNNQHGRFTAVDPLLASGKSANPQTFNRYVYVINNPLLLTDPDGLQAGNHTGAVYYKVMSNGAWAFSDRGGKGYDTRYTGPQKSIVGVDGYQYRVRSNGWTQGSKVADGPPARMTSPSQGISTAVTKPAEENTVRDLVTAVTDAPMFQVAKGIHKAATPDAVNVSVQAPVVPFGVSGTLTSDLDVIVPPHAGRDYGSFMQGGVGASASWVTDTDSTTRREDRTSFFEGPGVNGVVCNRLCVGGSYVPGQNGAPDRTAVNVGVSPTPGGGVTFGYGIRAGNLLGLPTPNREEER